jgi:gluconolactonase
MKKVVFLLPGLVGMVVFYSCQKSTNSADQITAEITSLSFSSKNFQEGSSFFDPGNLISASQHGVLDTLEKGFKFTEGPAVDKQGNVFFTDQPDDRIYKWDVVSGQTTLFLQGTGRSNGMAFDKDGNLIACADMHGELWKIHLDGSHEVLVNNYNGKLLNGPNDVWINPVTGGIYITDPMFPRGYWDNNDPRKINNPGWPPVYSDQGAGIAGHVYYLAQGSHSLVRVTGSFAGWNPQSSWPNGLAGSPDGKKLYINKWNFDGTGGIWVFDINSNGSLSNMQPFVPGLNFCDGMSMDEKGNVYVSTNEGVVAYDPAGNRILTIPTGGGSTNNVFAGKNNKLLFITGGGPTSPPFPNNNDRIMSVKMNVKGVEKF